MSWGIDLSNSRIQFSARYMMVSNVRGRFERFAGSVEFDENELERSSLTIQIETASINSQEPLRDAHLKSPDFLDADHYPLIYFKSKLVEFPNGPHGRVAGDLTIRDITREVVMNVEYAGQAKSPWGSFSADFIATVRINREDWGMTWNQALETGGLLVGDHVTISIDLSLLKKDEAQSSCSGQESPVTF